MIIAIHELEARLGALAQQMVVATEEKEWGQVQSLNREYREVEVELARLMARWERAEVGDLRLT